MTSDPRPWTAADAARARELREQRQRTDAERAELRELAHRETVESFRLRREAEYRRAYNAGWRYSQSPTATLDNANGKPDAWFDGYLDLAAGREKWHLAHCAGTDCDEHGPEPRTPPLGRKENRP
jgi:hypothetical protein